jgi:hypothetical protein
MSHLKDLNSVAKSSHDSILTDANFGGTVYNINGGLECPPASGSYHATSVKERLNQYCKAASELSVDALLGLDDCGGLQTAFDECATGGTPACPDCVAWVGVTTSVSSYFSFLLPCTIRSITSLSSSILDHHKYHHFNNDVHGELPYDLS